jgi:glycosyltransferase involved in cell wall biosynthesis
MKIAINARFLLEGKLEGIGGYTFEIVKRMVTQHPEDEFFFFFDRPFSEQFIVGKNVTPVVLFPPARHPFLWYAWFEWAVPCALKKYNCDVFFSPDNYLSLRTDVPTVMVLHDLAFKHFSEGISKINALYYNYFVPKFVAKAKKILTVSAYVKEDVVQNYAIPKEKIIVNYNGCRSIFKPLNIENQELIKEKYSNGKPYFFYVGAVHPRKNIHRLITAFDLFKKQTNAPHQLLIAGRFAWKTGEVSDAYQNATHQKDIVFLNYVADEVLAELMASAFALTYISLFEGFGVPLLEAMYCDVPVITADVTSMPEVIGEAGICVSPTNIEAMAETMISLYEQPDLVKKCIEKGKIQRTKFDWNRSAEEVYQVLKEVTKL